MLELVSFRGAGRIMRHGDLETGPLGELGVVPYPALLTFVLAFGPSPVPGTHLTPVREVLDNREDAPVDGKRGTCLL